MMKRIVLILALALLATGCAKDNTEIPQAAPTGGVEQNVPTDYEKVEHYLASVKEQSDALRHSLEHDELTQTDMNAASQELYKLWDDTLNYLWNELAVSLTEEEYAKLQNEQSAWVAERESAVKEAGKGFEGGSIYPLIANSEAAKVTEARVYELYEILK